MNSFNLAQKFVFALILAITITLLIIVAINKGSYKCRDCNIILISIDTLRADHLGCYGYTRNTSPNIDGFSKDSVLFSKCIASSSSTLTSHASILTSLIPSHHGAYFTREQALPPEIKTIAEILHANGYKTISFNDGGQIAPQFGLNQGFDLYKSNEERINIAEFRFRRIAEKTIKWIEQNPDEKFFLFLHTYETHHPYTPEKRYLNLFETNYSGDLPMHTSQELIRQINTGQIKISKEDKKHIVNTYDAEIRSMDESFGILLDSLKKKKLYDKTIIIFTSDHGEEFDEHGIMATHSHTLYNELLYVPLIIKFGNSKYALKELNGLTRIIDIMPTLLDIIDIKHSEILEGISLMPMISGRKINSNLFAISQRDMNEIYGIENWSIMNEKWKLYNSRLYDLKNDPFEKIDVSKYHEDIKMILSESAAGFIQQKRIYSPEEKVKLDKMLKEKLKSLGYIR